VAARCGVLYVVPVDAERWRAKEAEALRGIFGVDALFSDRRVYTGLL
jgi:hypothetical protein